MKLKKKVQIKNKTIVFNSSNKTLFFILYILNYDKYSFKTTLDYRSYQIS